jgi:uncharacterized protein
VFKRLELSDLTEVTSITHRFAPYSDFNFVSMWSWDISDGCEISTLHGNLVVRMNDYVSGSPFYTFIGDSFHTETAQEIAFRSDSEGLGTSVRLLPEFVAQRLDRSRVVYEMDMDGSDYILSTTRIKRFEGQDYRTKRKEANRFARENPTFTLTRLDLGDRAVVSKIRNCFETWALRKGTPQTYELSEFKAMNRLLHAIDFLPEVRGLGVFVGTEMVAFALIELVQQRHGMGHYLKANTEYPGVCSFLMRELGELLSAEGYDHLNVQQDLGITGLRQNKGSYIPANYLRKYTATRRTVTSQRPGISLRPTLSQRPSLLSIPMADSFLTTGDGGSLPGFASLRAPSVSQDLFDLLSDETDERDGRNALRQSQILPKQEDGDEGTDSERVKAG